MDKRNKKTARSIEVTGRTVEKALEEALRALGAGIDEVEIEILEPGQKGILSIFGSREARIRVTRRSSSKGIEEIVDDITKVVMQCLDVNYRIFTEEKRDETYINIETAGVDGLLIGRKGDTLNSLQHLIGRIVSKKMGGYQRMTLDIGGYLRNRQEILRQKAIKAVGRAKKGGRDVPLEPMKASERRIIHMTVADLEGATTYTVGDGELRRVYISPVQGQENKRRKNRY